MGRHRAFDEDSVLDAAIECFWQRGYESTSMRDLAAEMRMGGASLYNAFGDKRALFGIALQRYLDRSSRRRMAQLDAATDPLAALHVFFADLIDASLADHRGCMLVNSAMEVAPFDAALGNDIRAAIGEIEEGFRRTVERAKANRSVRSSDSSEDIARRLLAAVLSLRVLARACKDRALFESIARSALPPLEKSADT